MDRLPLVSPVDRLLFLKAQPYILRQPGEVLAALASYTEERYYPAGSEIRAQGAAVDPILFLGEGRVEILDLDIDAAHPNVVDAPGVVGMTHHFAGRRKGPCVRAVTDTVCLVIGVDDLDQILEDHFSLLLQFAQRSGAETLRGLQALGECRPSEEGFDDDHLRETPATLDLVQRLGLVRRMPFLKGTNLTVLGQLIRFETPHLIPRSQPIWQAGAPVDSMALIIDGAFRLVEAPGSVRAERGATLGAWEILSREPRAETWVAESASRVLTIDRALFTDLLEDHFEFALAYLRQSSRTTLSSWAALAVR